MYLAKRYMLSFVYTSYLLHVHYIFLSQVKYNINKVQLKMLQITSRHAEQAVTVHCKNLAFKDRELMFHTMKSGSFIKPHTFSDGCSVSQNTDAFLIRSFPSLSFQQMSSSAGASSNIMLKTKRPRQLPVTDISLWLGSSGEEAMAVEFGPVCFSR